MTDLIVACVRTGSAYDFGFVMQLRDMVAEHLKQPHTIVCLTDQRERCSGVAFVDVAALSLPGSWAKLALFEPMWRDQAKVLYLDLDTRIKGNLAPLADVPGEFAILESPARAITPCRFDSSVMLIGGGMCEFVWRGFERRRAALMTRHAYYGVNGVIETLYPSAPTLQRLLPKVFFGSTVVLAG
jgi:hypothetical protein